MAMFALALLPVLFFSLLRTSIAGMHGCTQTCKTNECCDTSGWQPECVVINSTRASSFGYTTLPFSSQKSCNPDPSSPSTWAFGLIMSVVCLAAAFGALYGLYSCLCKRAEEGEESERYSPMPVHKSSGTV
eukprot:TRINITY_DN30996_c0_g1_i1.p1 TRINITY_DN30996_c0_g1~~TRINITY_DN30996_c0_g1_i1.p1  ORF type:complete len:131 (+),score=5.32 TRINITY_DN30996_c0_g1_i1:100-492(+)